VYKEGKILFSAKDVVGSTKREDASYGTKSEWIREPKGELA
jgi:hypothetical protein